MNWIEISLDFPKAYHKWLLWTSNRNFSFRDLYEFFDENGIVITVDATWERGKAGNCPTEWKVRIGAVYVNGNINDAIGKSFYRTRSEAEDTAFKSGFHFLERNLNKDDENEDEI